MFQRWNLQRRATSNQRCVFQRWYEQRRNKIVIFNIEFHNIGKRRNNIVKMTNSGKKKQKKIITQIEYKEFKVLTTIS